MNKGIKKAQGNWLYFLDSDDYLIDDKTLETVIKLMGEEVVSFVYVNVIVPDYGGLYGGEFDVKRIVYQNICNQAIFFKKSIFPEWGISIRNAADFSAILSNTNMTTC